MSLAAGGSAFRAKADTRKDCLPNRQRGKVTCPEGTGSKSGLRFPAEPVLRHSVSTALREFEVRGGYDQRDVVPPESGSDSLRGFNAVGSGEDSRLLWNGPPETDPLSVRA